MGMYHESVMKIWKSKKKLKKCVAAVYVNVRPFANAASLNSPASTSKKNIQTYNPKRWFRPTTVQAFAGNFTAWVLQEKEKFGAKGRANESSVFYGPGHMIGFWYAEYKMPRDLARFEPVTSLVIRPQDVLTTQFIQEGMYKLSR
jgi:hypothetical protein